MTFIITLIALLIERFFDWSHLRRWRWYIRLQDLIVQKLPGYNPYLLLIFAILPVLILTYTLKIIFHPILFGFAELVFQLLLFVYCLGPQNLWADTFACFNAFAHGDKGLVKDKLKTTFGITANGPMNVLHEQLLHQIFIAGNKRVFAIVFWFMLLGPIGAVFYRCVNVSTTVSATAPAARYVESLLDFFPIRLFTVIFALSGQFVQVFSRWRKKAIQGFQHNDQLLIECGAAALGKENIEDLAYQEATVEKHIISLLDRSLVMALVFIAIFIII